MGRTPVAKAAFWATTDAEARKLGERTGLDTLVVLARHRLLHQDMDYRLHRRPGHIEMKAGRNDDRDRVRGAVDRKSVV